MDKRLTQEEFESQFVQGNHGVSVIYPVNFVQVLDSHAAWIEKMGKATELLRETFREMAFFLDSPKEGKYLALLGERAMDICAFLADTPMDSSISSIQPRGEAPEIKA